MKGSQDNTESNNNKITHSKPTFSIGTIIVVRQIFDILHKEIKGFLTKVWENLEMNRVNNSKNLLKDQLDPFHYSLLNMSIA